jgi:O-acetyl-ADP-ribose deacetylase (regulator of RNase III)
VVQAWRQAFSGKEVPIRAGEILKARADALLCPANSFGDMSGGLDRAIDLHFDGKAQPAVQEAIREAFLGELPVGCAILVPLRKRSIRFLVVAPTMRIPGLLGESSLNAYLALRAALVAVARFNPGPEPPIRRLACPGLCTGVGGMKPQDSAKQMAAAYRSVVLGRWRDAAHPAMAPFALTHE